MKITESVGRLESAHMRAAMLLDEILDTLSLPIHQQQFIFKLAPILDTWKERRFQILKAMESPQEAG